MITSLLLLAAGPSSFEPESVAVDENRVQLSDMRVDVGESVRAVTWDELKEKPAAPVTIRLACLVLAPVGVPGSCIPADRIPAGQARINWAKLANQFHSTWPEHPTLESELLRIAEKRIRTSLVFPDRRDDEFMIVRFFDVAIDPSDARPPLDTDNPLQLADVSLATPLDTGLIQKLFPVLAVREGFGAQVRVTCRVEVSLDLLCRDAGTITPIPGDAFQQTDHVAEEFRLATYQIASTIKLEPKTRSGADVVGRNIVISIRWML